MPRSKYTPLTGTLGLLLTLANLAAAQPSLRLDLREAVRIGLEPEGSTRVRLAEQAVRKAEARSRQTRADLLPQVNGAVSSQSRTTNLDALGIQIQVPVPGFIQPRFVGPFSTFDARGSVNRTVLDWSVIERYRTARLGVEEAELESDSLKDQVAAAIARTYIAALEAAARVRSAEANLELADRLVRLAENTRQAGTGLAVEVTRSRVQLAHERQALLAAENDHRRAELELARAMGVSFHRPLELAPAAASTAELPELDARIEQALAGRADLKAQQQRAERAERQHKAVGWERLPSVHGFADYGSLGRTPGNSLPTRTFGVALRVPVFDGGRREARRAETAADWRQEQIRAEDLRAQIELEVRVAWDRLRSAAEQQRVAEEGLTLAEQEVEQARRRYQAGVATSVELTDAQTRLARARENHLAAVYQQAAARIDLAAAAGTVRQVIEQGL